MLPNREVKPENAAKMAIYGLFPLCGNGKGVSNRKKVAKTSGFLFLQWEDRHDRARLNTLFAYSGISPHRFESFAPGNTTKNRPKAVSFSEIWLGQQDSRALRALFPLAQAPAGKSLKTCHQHVFLTGFHLIGSNPLHPAMRQKTARRRFRY